MIDKIKLREWTRLSYIDPTKYLKGLSSLNHSVDLSGFPDQVLDMHLRSLEHHRETREAAIFSHGLSQCVLGNHVDFAMSEDSDYDFITRTVYDDEVVYVPVQTKELPPESICSKSIESELEKLTKYARSDDLVVAYHLNREMSINMKKLVIPELNIAGIFFFGKMSSPNNRWFMYGGMLGEFGGGKYELPYA